MADITWGAEAEFSTQSPEMMRCCQIDTDKFVVVYQPSAGGERGWAIVATVSGTTVSFGTAVQFSTGTVIGGFQLDVCKLDTNKFAVVWADGDLDWDGYARVGTVSGTTITFGDAVEFYNGDTESAVCCQLDTDKFAIVYNDELAGDHGYVCICTVSGTTITPGTPVQFDASYIFNTRCCQLGIDKLVAVYTNKSDSWYGWACVITVSGTTPSPGTPQRFDNTGSTAGFDCNKLETDKFAIAWGNTTKTDAYVLVATVSGTVITFGAFATLPYSTHNGVATVDSSRFVVCLCNRDSGDDGTSYSCSVSGTTITLGGAEVFDTTALRFMHARLIASDKVIVVYQDEGTPEHGIARAGTITTAAAPPTVTTQAASDVDTTSCTGNGNITDIGVGNATRRGFCYKVGISGDPTTADSVVYDDDNFGVGAYTKAITGLAIGTGYRVRAYAVNADGTGYGATVQVTTLAPTPVADGDLIGIAIIRKS